MATQDRALEGKAHGRAVEMGSNRSFGLVFAAVFALFALLPLKDGHGPTLWAGALALAFLAVALLAPRLLAPLNRVWFLFGLLLHRVISPLVMGLMFFAVITPLALLMRALGKRPLALDRDSTAVSYWIVRTPPGPDRDSLRRQF
ncbi:conserved membrane hypothetical protein [Candidatus Terasakiella magnetica]|nr:conserved membrane hypothetical protein [Candidatus Terasakiella magnetica]